MNLVRPSFPNVFLVYYFKYLKMHALAIKCHIFLWRTPEIACLLTQKLCTNFCSCAHDRLRDAAELMCQGGSQASESPGFKFVFLGFFFFFEQFGLLYASGFTAPWAEYNTGIAPWCHPGTMSQHSQHNLSFPHHSCCACTHPRTYRGTAVDK